MIEIKTDWSDFFDIQTSTEWDCNMNDHCGGNKLVIKVNPAYKLTQMETDITNIKFENDDLKRKMQDFLDREAQEAKLREDWPALQDVWSQYQMVKHMLEDAKKPKKEPEDASK